MDTVDTNLPHLEAFLTVRKNSNRKVSFSQFTQLFQSSFVCCKFNVQLYVFFYKLFYLSTNFSISKGIKIVPEPWIANLVTLGTHTWSVQYGLTVGRVVLNEGHLTVGDLPVADVIKSVAHPAFGLACV